MVAIWLPFVGFVINGLLALKKINRITLTSLVGVGSVALPFGIFSYLTFLSNTDILSSEGIRVFFFQWIKAGTFQVDFAYRLDGLSLFMVWIITGVGSLIHLYSTGYMAEEKEHYARFFSYLNLFIFFMLHLVLGDNLVLMFLGWEGVGLCSYLLIGFDYQKNFASTAGKKAFITNRIGDAGFLLGMFLLYREAGSLNYSEIFSYMMAESIPAETIHWIAILFFIGAIGKSAQIPLHVWLPDAMAGPTPVSALIHAATMVTAGLFMIVRLAPIFLSAPEASLVIAYVGAFTAFFSALIAVTQTNIKKVLAYSTISQLGYMFLALGVGAYGAGMFHLMTHAFFKALLFLGSGAVIIAFHHEQDMRKMGKLHSPLKFISIIFWIGAIAISGIPGFSGFFSKDMILEQAYTYKNGGNFLFSIGLASAFLTSFYMYRLIFLTFYGEKIRSTHKVHDVGWNMKFPLLVLAILSVVGGYVGLPHLFTHRQAAIVEYFDTILPVTPTQTTAAWHNEISIQIEALLMISSIFAAILGLLFAFYRYQKLQDVPVADGAFRRLFTRYSYHKFYVDELYSKIILKPIKRIAHFSYRTIDDKIIDGMVDGLAQAALFFGSVAKRLQTGQVNHYTFYIVLYILLLLGFFIGGML